MKKLYIQHLTQNSPLLVNLLASITLQVSLDTGPSPRHKKFKKTLGLEVKFDPEVLISLKESDLDTRKGMESDRRTRKHL